MSIHTQRKAEFLLQMIQATKEEELTCGDCLERLSEFVDHKLQNLQLDQALKEVEDHLASCGDCTEEYEMIRTAVEAIDRS
jgi:hypothetical protein